jgi:hypothetical protein
MRDLKFAILFAAASLGSIPSAFAGAGAITTTIAPLQVEVTYSKDALTTYVGYTVQVANAGGNTINNIRFTARTSVTDPAEAAVFSSAEGAICTPTAVVNEIQCAIGQLTAGVAHPTVALFFKAPVKIAQGVADGTGEDTVTLTGTTYYAEGTGGLNSTPDNSINEWGPVASVVLGTDNPTLVKSAVPKAGGTFFTGAGGVSNGNDKFTTSVKVPAAASFSKATIDESTTCGAGVNFFYTCYQSALSIVDALGATVSFAPPYLAIVLRQDASNIRSGTKIGSIDIYYSPDPDTIPPAKVNDCPSPTTVYGGGVPCIAKRVYYKNGSVPGWTPDLDKDFEWWILNDQNGTYKFPG